MSYQGLRRGLQYMHFTQNENSEKLESPGLIGKFGVGLKDALGVFYRNNIDVTIHSKYSTVTLAMSSKPGFNVQTLHAVFSEPEHPNMEGTDVILTGITKDALQKAKSMFLVFDENLELWKLQTTAKYIPEKMMKGRSYMQMEFG